MTEPAAAGALFQSGRYLKGDCEDARRNGGKGAAALMMEQIVLYNTIFIQTALIWHRLNMSIRPPASLWLGFGGRDGYNRDRHDRSSHGDRAMIRPGSELHLIGASKWSREQVMAHLEETFRHAVDQRPDLMEPYLIRLEATNEIERRRSCGRRCGTRSPPGIPVALPDDGQQAGIRGQT